MCLFLSITYAVAVEMLRLSPDSKSADNQDFCHLRQWCHSVTLRESIALEKLPSKNTFEGGVGKYSRNEVRLRVDTDWGHS